MSTVQYKTEKVDGLNIFYREAGDKKRPTIVLLHGFPSSSFMFRDLIPILAPHFHVVAPDYPGFGHSDMPAINKFDYSFDHLADVTEKFLKQTGNTNFFVYLQDYGGPVGFRIAVRHPDWIRGLIIQNANAYDEGVSDLLRSKLEPIWKERNAKTEATVLDMFTPDGTRFQYVTGAKDAAAMNPDPWVLDQALLDRDGSKKIQLQLQATYNTNLKRYDEWHQYFRLHQPPTLIAWGKGDPIFTVKGAEAYKRDLKHVSLTYFDTGHFALEEQSPAIGARIIEFVTSH